VVRGAPAAVPRSRVWHTLERRLLAFEARYKATASLFNWRYTKTDLNAYLDRLATHEPLSPAA